MVWFVFEVKEIKDYEDKNVLCPRCYSGAMLYQKFPTFCRCECQDCGTKFYVALDKKALEHVAIDVMQPAKSKHWKTTLLEDNAYCPEHGMIRLPLLEEEEGKIGLVNLCPKCKKPLQFLNEDSYSWKESQKFSRWFRGYKLSK
jgi:hypothetical protein